MFFSLFRKDRASHLLLALPLLGRLRIAMPNCYYKNRFYISRRDPNGKVDEWTCTGKANTTIRMTGSEVSLYGFDWFVAHLVRCGTCEGSSGRLSSPSNKRKFT